MSESQPLPPSATVLAVLLYCLWGSMYVAAKIGYRDASPLFYSGIRMIPASAALYALARWKRIPLRLSRRQWRVVGAIATLFFIDTSLLYLGLSYTSIGHSTILINSSVVFIMLLSRPCLGVRVSLVQWCGVACAFAGIVLVMKDRGRQGHEVTMLGDLLMLGAGLMWALYNIVYKRVGNEVQNTAMVFYMDALTMAPFMLVAPLIETVRFTFTPSLVLSALYVAIFTHAFGFLILNWLLVRYDAGRVTSFMFIMPVVGVFLGALVFDEQVSLWVLGGLALVCLGIYLANRAPRRA